MANSAQPSGLDQLIPGEIKGDAFYQLIYHLAQQEPISTVLEIGSSSGQGSTEAFVMGLRENPAQPQLFCMEISKTRFAELAQCYQADPFVVCYNCSSVSRSGFVTEQDVIDFYTHTPSNLNVYPLPEVLAWLQQDIDYVTQSGVPDDGIQRIKQAHQIDTFDLVLIDGSEFTGAEELDQIYGAKLILLDDINTLKNYQNHQRLLADEQYDLIYENRSVRHGFSAFKRADYQLSSEPIVPAGSQPLPIHFFTIVLNGDPFIRYHIDLFNQLPFAWHWHIVEGVADLTHDTAWSLRNGGRIPETVHRHGLSNDGTTDYLNQLQQQYPDTISLYRKANGSFWDGKREMVNAPLDAIQAECLLWQIDVDELWTVDQIKTVWTLFHQHPEKTAAYYWCWFFVGEQLIINSRHCYAQNPQQDWLRTWRFKPGYVWAAHEPPQLVEPLPDGSWQDRATLNPFLQDELEEHGAVFQHFAYVMPEQLTFKQDYYGYKNAVAEWQRLQAESHFPVRLRHYFSWVGDFTSVDRAATYGVVPLMQRSHDSWRFLAPDALEPDLLPMTQPTPIIVIDSVFFQHYKTGIARVWRSLLEEWVQSGFNQHVIVLDRAGTAPEIAGIRYRVIPPYDANDVEGDRQLLQQICDDLGADVFISTYFSTPVSTPTVLMLYDMIPEVMGEGDDHPIVRDKRHAIDYASSYIAISQNTATDLAHFFPEQPPATVAHCGVSAAFAPASGDRIAQFKAKYDIQRPYVMVTSVDNLSPYKNNGLFFQAFSHLANKAEIDIVATAIAPALPEEWREAAAGSTVHLLRLSDDELAVAYAGAIALVYPSIYEGFGMPVLEAMACGCPVITCANSSIPEVAGDAVLYVGEQDVTGLAAALSEVQRPDRQAQLRAAGLAQAARFSWGAMATTVSAVLVDATLQFLNLRQINLIAFPDWHQSEADLYAQLEEAIAAVLVYPDQTQISLIIDISQATDEIDPNLVVADVVMNLLMQLELETEPGIATLAELSPIQWQQLRPHLAGVLALTPESGASAALQGYPLARFSPDELTQLLDQPRSVSSVD